MKGAKALGIILAGLLLAQQVPAQGKPQHAIKPQPIQLRFVLLAAERAAQGSGVTLTNNCPSVVYVGMPMSCTFTATGGTPPYHFSVVSGMWPPGLSLNSATGVVSGTPAAIYGPTNLRTMWVKADGTQEFEVTNVGKRAQIFNLMTLTGPLAREYQIVPGGTCRVGRPVQVGGTCTVRVTRKPVVMLASSARR